MPAKCSWIRKWLRDVANQFSGSAAKVVELTNKLIEFYAQDPVYLDLVSPARPPLTF